MKKGFTLIELLVVIILLGLLMTFAYPNVLSVYNNVKHKTMILQENTVRQRAQMYVSDCYDTETKMGLTGCANTNITADQGYVYLSDLINDEYMEEVSYNGESCTGYIDYRTSEYTVCLRCGDQANPSYTTDNLSCTFDHSDSSYASLPYTGTGYYAFNVSGTSGNGVNVTPSSGPAGYYKIELWGASGSTLSNATSYGAYTSGVIKLKEGDTLYIYVGGAGGERTNSTSYNGGVSSMDGYPGGGATDVRLSAGDWNSASSLASRIMVAAGGGGGVNGKAGGGLIGWPNEAVEISGGKQIGGGTSNVTGLSGGFGLGGLGCGGGSGYYGGAGGETCEQGGAGGSSFISGHTGCVSIEEGSASTPKTGCVNTQNGTAMMTTSCSIHYSNKTFTNTIMIDGNGYPWTYTKSSSTTKMPSTEYGKFFGSGRGNLGNGFARISYVGA